MAGFERELIIRQKIGNRLAKWRKSKRITQTSLAKKINVTQAALSRMEKGDLPLHNFNLIALYKLGMDLNYLITGEYYISDEIAIKNKEKDNRIRRLEEKVAEHEKMIKMKQKMLDEQEKRLYSLIDKLVEK